MIILSAEVFTRSKYNTKPEDDNCYHIEHICLYVKRGVLCNGRLPLVQFCV